MRTTPLVTCQILQGFPPLDLWIEKMAFNGTCHIQSNSSHGIQAPMVLDHCSKRWFFEKPYKVTIGERSEWRGGSHELRNQGLVWFTDDSKTKKALEPRRGDMVEDMK